MPGGAKDVYALEKNSSPFSVAMAKMAKHYDYVSERIID